MNNHVSESCIWRAELLVMDPHEMTIETITKRHLFFREAPWLTQKNECRVCGKPCQAYEKYSETDHSDKEWMPRLLCTQSHSVQ